MWHIKIIQYKCKWWKEVKCVVNIQYVIHVVQTNWIAFCYNVVSLWGDKSRSISHSSMCWIIEFDESKCYSVWNRDEMVFSS